MLKWDKIFYFKVKFQWVSVRNPRVNDLKNPSEKRPFHIITFFYFNVKSFVNIFYNFYLFIAMQRSAKEQEFWNQVIWNYQKISIGKHLLLLHNDRSLVYLNKICLLNILSNSSKYIVLFLEVKEFLAEKIY